MGKKVENRAWFTSQQEQFLALVSKTKYLSDKFYLTGGTALSACYYNHRESLDLDLFSPVEFSIDEIGKILSQSKRNLGWIGIKKDINYPSNVYILTWENGYKLKLDFNYFLFKRLKKGKLVLGVDIDSLEDIAVNKLDATISRREMRDYIDLYMIMTKEKMLFGDILKMHRKKTEFELSHMGAVKALLKVHEAVNMPRMYIDFNIAKMVKFFENEARKLKEKILI